MEAQDKLIRLVSEYPTSSSWTELGKTYSREKR